jgi:hypothetical protein
MPQTLSDCLCDLFIDIANASRTGNCNRLKLNGMSFGIIRICGIKTFSPQVLFFGHLLLLFFYKPIVEFLAFLVIVSGIIYFIYFELQIGSLLYRKQFNNEAY